MAEDNSIQVSSNDQVYADQAAASAAAEAIDRATKELEARKQQLTAGVRQQQARFATWRLRQQDDLHRRQQALQRTRMTADSTVFAHAQARAQEIAALESRVQSYAEGIERAKSYVANPNYQNWQPGGGTLLTLPAPSGGG